MEITRVEQEPHTSRIAELVGQRVLCVITNGQPERGFVFARLPRGSGSLFVHCSHCLNGVLPAIGQQVLLTVQHGREEGKYEGRAVEVVE